MKILLSAFSCEPDKGSENEVGYQTLRAAASAHDVWLLTLSDNVASLERAIAAERLEGSVRVEGVEFGVSGPAFDDLSMPRFQWLYDAWQRSVARRAVAMDRRVAFDVVHHVTLSSYWTRPGVAAVPKPLLLGPMGGGVDAPVGLMPEFGLRGGAEGIARKILRPMLAEMPFIKGPRERATLILAQNGQTGRRLGSSRRVMILSNALAADVGSVHGTGERTADIAVVGRLLAWKAPSLALRVLSRSRSTDAVLRFFGDGPERARVESLARRMGLLDRVRFEGWIPRERLLVELRHAGVLLHPSLHEEAGLCIAEALSLGTPVVCIAHGGPAEIVRHWPATASALVAPSTPRRTAGALAAAVDRFLADPPPLPDDVVAPTTSFAEAVLEAYRFAAEETTRDR